MGQPASQSNDNDPEESPENLSAAQQLRLQGATVLQNPRSFVAQAQDQSTEMYESTGTQTQPVDMAVQTESMAS